MSMVQTSVVQGPGLGKRPCFKSLGEIAARLDEQPHSDAGQSLGSPKNSYEGQESRTLASTYNLV